METLTSPKLQTTSYVEKESSEDEFDKACYMIQGNDSLEVNSDTQEKIVIWVCCYPSCVEVIVVEF